jgi:hypothetical protein
VGLQIALQRYHVQILGRKFQFDGEVEPLGQVLDFLNNESRSTFSLYDVKILPVMPSGPLTAITRSEITVSESELGLIFFLDADYRQQVPVLKSFDRVIAYTPHAVLRGNFHRGVETRLGDMFDTLQGAFFVMTEVSIFPTTGLPAPFPKQADLLIVNRFYVNLYHPE